MEKVILFYIDPKILVNSCRSLTNHYQLRVLQAWAGFTNHAYLRAEIRLSFDCMHIAFFLYLH